MHFLWYRKFETTWSRYCIILPCPNAILIPHCGMLAHTHIRLLAQCRQRQSERQNQDKRENKRVILSNKVSFIALRLCSTIIDMHHPETKYNV